MSRTLVVAVTGATGFVGRHVCRVLAKRGHRVRALVRPTSRAKVSHLPATAQAREGDALDRASLDALLGEADACIHLVGILGEHPETGATYDRLHVEATRNVVEASEAAGIVRHVHMSSLGARPHAPTAYHRSKFVAEEVVRRSRLAWTIIRPSVIHGPDGEFTRLVAKWARGKALPFLFIPYFGRGLMGQGRQRSCSRCTSRMSPLRSSMR